jgi:hypothetical protein
MPMKKRPRGTSGTRRSRRGKSDIKVRQPIPVALPVTKRVLETLYGIYCDPDPPG